MGCAGYGDDLMILLVRKGTETEAITNVIRITPDRRNLVNVVRRDSNGVEQDIGHIDLNKECVELLPQD